MHFHLSPSTTLLTDVWLPPGDWGAHFFTRQPVLVLEGCLEDHYFSRVQIHTPIPAYLKHLSPPVSLVFVQPALTELPMGAQPRAQHWTHTSDQDRRCPCCDQVHGPALTSFSSNYQPPWTHCLTVYRLCFHPSATSPHSIWDLRRKMPILSLRNTCQDSQSQSQECKQNL